MNLIDIDTLAPAFRRVDTQTPHARAPFAGRDLAVSLRGVEKRFGV